MITEYFGDFYPYRKFFVTDNAEVEQILGCVPGSEAININTKELWLLQSDNKWHKFGAAETRNASQ